jgi:hypothetical protein
MEHKGPHADRPTANKGRRRMMQRVVRWCALSLACLCIAPLLRGQCRVPPYRVGKVLGYTAPTVIADISIRPEDFTIEKLLCLAGALKMRYRHAPEIAVGIFGSHKAAVNFVAPSVEKLPDEDLWASQLHADYYYNAEKGEESVTLIPDLLSSNPQLSTRIDLPVTGKPSCRLQIQDRCLIAFDHKIFYVQVSKDRSAKVTLTAEIQQNGSVAGVRLANAETTGSVDERQLAESAIRNLGSWQFERSNTKVPIRVTYSVEWVDTPLNNGIDVQFKLPDCVDIKRGPLLVTPPK